MTWFRVKDESTAKVAADRERVWAVLTDPDKIVAMTPFLREITVDGEHWRWHLGVISALGQRLAPTFTEHMELTPRTVITFTHDPPEGAAEVAGVDGTYELGDAEDGGTILSITFAVQVDLPLPRAMGLPVRTAMRGVLATMGQGFARGLERELARSS